MRNEIKAMKQKKRKPKLKKKLKEQKMLGTFTEKLDKDTSLISLLIISIITFSVASSGWLNAINISGVFKQ